MEFKVFKYPMGDSYSYLNRKNNGQVNLNFLIEAMMLNYLEFTKIYWLED